MSDVETELAELECRYENHIDEIRTAHRAELTRLRSVNERLVEALDGVTAGYQKWKSAKGPFRREYHDKFIAALNVARTAIASHGKPAHPSRETK